MPNLLNGERGWMAFTAMKGSTYFIDSILAKCVFGVRI